MKLKQLLAAASAASLLGGALALLFEAAANAARRYQGARSLEDAMSGSTGLWHAIAIEAPLRTLAPLAATVAALRVVKGPFARDGALVGALAGLTALAAEQSAHGSSHAVFEALVAATFGAALGACAAELQSNPRAGSPLLFAWFAHTGSSVTMLVAEGARARAAVLLAALLTVSITAAHAYLQRRRRRLRDDVGATFSLASRTLQSLAPWQLRGAAEHLSLRWLAFGVLTTLGVLMAACVAAVAAGHALGLDFATFEREDGAASSDIAFVGAFVLAAFALSGWLLGRVAAVRATSESILGPLLLVPVMVIALPTGRAGFLLTVAFALVAALFTAAGAVMARRSSA